jgi:hypothetical protein
VIKQDLIDAGYHEYSSGTKLKGEDYYLAKIFKDEIGKKYQITFYVFDWSKYPQHIGERLSFMPVLYLYGKDITFDTETTVNADSSKVTLVEIESYCLGLWRQHGEHYHSIYGEES